MMINYIKCVHFILYKTVNELSASCDTWNINSFIKLQQVVMSEYPKSSLLYFGVWKNTIKLFSLY